MIRRIRPRFAIRRLLLAMLPLGALAPHTAPAQERLSVPPLQARPTPATRRPPADTAGLRFHLSEGADAPPRIAAPTATPLSTTATALLLARLRPLPARAPLTDSAAVPPAPRPRPRTGPMVLAPFPPRDSAPPPAPAPLAALRVLRHAPQGEADIGQGLTAQFSQPMVPLSSVGEVAAHTVPLRLSPEPAGRWLDVSTLVFEPELRLPRATRFSAELPVGVGSAVGGRLAEAVRWEFRTPPARAIGGYPFGELVVPRPLVVVAFDTDVDPAALLPAVRMVAGRTTVPLRLATAAEIEADKAAREALQGWPARRWAAFAPLRALPAGARVRVVVGAGTPSAEGPLTTTIPQEWEFRTHGALRVAQHGCGYAWQYPRGGDEPAAECRPGDVWAVRFTTPLAQSVARDSALVRVEPALPGLRVVVRGDQLIIQGAARPRTNYRVLLSPRLTDQFGQTLGETRPLTIEVGDPERRLSSFAERMLVLDPTSPARIPVHSRGIARLRVRMARVQPADWQAFRAVTPDWRRSVQDHDSIAALPGQELPARVLAVPGDGIRTVETLVDLAPALRDGLGQVVLLVEPAEWAGKDRPRVLLWVQSTRIGVHAFSDAGELSAWTSSLADGRPLTGVRLSLLAPPRPIPATALTAADGLATLPLPSLGRDDPEPLLTARLGDDLAILPSDASSRYQYYPYSGYGSWKRNEPGSHAAWYTFTDRHLYRPGETVRLKGWVRRLSGGKTSAPSPLAGVDSLRYRVQDATGNEIATGGAALSALGGFDLTFGVPAGTNLGTAHVMLTTGPRDPDRLGAQHAFQIEEFRRPEFEVSASASEGPHLPGDTAVFTARAAYFTGGGLPGGEARWSVTATPTTYTPPGWSDYRFGTDRGWFGWFGDRRGARQDTLSGQTDARGAHSLRVALERLTPPEPSALTALVTVMDANRQTWSATASTLVHPARVYVGLRGARGWQQRGEPIEVESVVTDLAGKLVPGREVEVRAERMHWKGEWVPEPDSAQSCRTLSAAYPRPCAFQTPYGGTYRVTASTTDDAGRSAFTRVFVWVMGAGRGAGEGALPALGDASQVQLVPDRREYAPGDTAKVLVRPPFYPASGVLSVRRGGLLRTDTVWITSATHTILVPVGTADVPNLHLQLDLVDAPDAAATAPDSLRSIATASGQAELRVSARERTLNVVATPRDTLLAPGERSTLEVRVIDHHGRPVRGAEVAAVVVDEAVLALTGYRLASPVERFYPNRPPGTRDVDLRGHVVVVPRDYEPRAGTLVGTVSDAAEGRRLAQATVSIEGTPRSAQTDEHGRFRLLGVEPGRYTLVVAKADFGEERLGITVDAQAHPALAITLLSSEHGFGEVGLAGGVAKGFQGLVPPAAPKPFGALTPPDPIGLRTNFDPLAHWTPVARTDADGRVRLEVALPDNLTRYRVVAVAVADSTLYGLGESAITARQPLMLRPSPPRFLNYGDHFELSALVQNQTDRAMEVEVAARGSGVEVEGPGQRVVVPAQDRVEIRFAARATRDDTARVQIAAAAGRWTDAAEVAIPVWTPAAAEAFATYGVLDSASVALPLQLPADRLPGFGALEVTTTSTAVHELTDALLYLRSYPFESAETIASRVLGVVAVRDVLAAFGSREIPPPEALAAAVAHDLRQLQALQNRDGGWGFWRADEPSWPYASLHVTHALVRAEAKGYAVERATMQRATAYLHGIAQRIPSDYPARERRALLAYALYLRDRLADRAAPAEARALADSVGIGELPLEAAAMLLGVVANAPAQAPLRAALLAHLGNRATETAAHATFAEGYTEGAYLLLHSQTRSDAIVLEALMAADPANPLVLKTARGLLAHRTRGRWSTSQENAWALLALDAYFGRYERQTPQFHAGAWLGARYLGGHDFAGRTTERHQLSIPMRALHEDTALLPADTATLTLAKEGAGRMYYRAGLRYAPASLELSPAQYGFAVARSYSAVDDSTDVRRDADGTWRVRAGARVRVTLTLTAPARRVHVALVDPLPAGFEALNIALRGTQSGGGGAGRPPLARWWRWSWYDHENLRDQRAELFASRLEAGVYTHSYLARATTPGSFIAPPAHAEEMYAPETFGRGGSERVVVEARR